MGRLSRLSARALVFQFIVSSTQLNLVWAQRPGDVVPTPRPDTNAARSAGQSDGQPDGSREGHERGRAEGQQQGDQQGYREGFDRCEREEKRRVYDDAYRDGYRTGEREGGYEGDNNGAREGRRDGDNQGTAEGQRLADEQANRDAQGPGTERGEGEANQSDARERGARDGEVEGERQARAHAHEVDYAAGREEYRASRFAAPVDHEDSFSQRGGTAPNTSEIISAVEDIIDPSGGTKSLSMFAAAAANPDFRYSNPRRSFATAEENNAYQQGYRDGYTNGFNGMYPAAFSSTNGQARQAGDQRGCQEARRRDYSSDRHRGLRDGREAGYRRAYDYAYQRAYRRAYDDVFSGARDQAYRATYQPAYDRHYETARNAAFRRRYQELYDAGFAWARQARYDETYPGFAQEEHANGIRDEQERFRTEPLFLEAVEATETINNGLYEPDEPLRLRLKLRNFALDDVASTDVRVTLRALDENSVVLSQGDAFLRNGLRANSRTTVSEALEFRMNESAAGTAKRFELQISYQGRVITTKALTVETKFLLSTEFASAPVFQEGMQTRVKIRVKNESQVSAEGVRLAFTSRPEVLEVLDPELGLASIAPGETRTLEFRVIARTSQSRTFPFVFTATLPSGRRIGVLDEAREVPVLNDYRLTVRNEVTALRHAGVSRVLYAVQNVNARLNLRALQLYVRVRDKDDKVMDEQMVVIGPNPQLITPLRRDQTHSFVVPFFVRLDNAGGRVEFEVKEDGHTVVIHQKEF